MLHTHVLLLCTCIYTNSFLLNVRCSFYELHYLLIPFLLLLLLPLVSDDKYNVLHAECRQGYYN